VTGLAVMAERGDTVRPPVSKQGGAPPEVARVCVGRIAGAHGVRGEVRIASYTDDPHDIASYGPVSDEDGARHFTIKPVRMAKSHLVARIDGIDDRDAAEALRGVTLYVSRAALPEPEDDEFYWEDLVGLRAETTGGEPLGTVLSVQDYGAGIMLEVGESARLATLVPFTRDIVPSVDLNAGILSIDPPAGLFSAADDDDKLEADKSTDNSGEEEGQ
jgi:16S rRNA processing protein RimM